MTLHDQHVHSEYSVDSKENQENYIKKAIEDGCEFFITTEHVDMNLCGRGDDWDCDFDKEIKYHQELQKKYPNIKILTGIECGYKREYLDKVIEHINSQNFDLINLSVHDYQTIDFYHKGEYEKRGIRPLLTLYFDICLDAVTTIDNFDVFSHFDYAFKTAKMMNPSICIDEYEEQLIKLFKVIIQKDKVLEVNTKVQETINDDEHVKYFLSLYKRLGGKNVSLSSDAHSLERYRSSFDRYLPIIKEVGFDHLCYFVNRKRFEYKL